MSLPAAHSSAPFPAPTSHPDPVLMASASTRSAHDGAVCVQLCCRASYCLCLLRQIRQAAAQDAGRYTCQGPGHRERHYNLDVWGKGRCG